MTMSATSQTGGPPRPAGSGSFWERIMWFLSGDVAAGDEQRSGEPGERGVGGQQHDSERGRNEAVGDLALDRPGDGAGSRLGGVLARRRDVPEQQWLEEQQPDAQPDDGCDLVSNDRSDPGADRGEEGRR